MSNYVTLPVAVPLCVPTWNQADALQAGAKWSDVQGCFEAPAGELLDPFWQWLPRRFNPDAPRPVLVPQMLPIQTWEQNVRHLFGGPTWDRMRRHAYRAAGLRCEICGVGGPLEAHESWELENESCTQRLVRIEALCPLCHKVHHLGIARRLGLAYAVERHMMAVNGWSRAQLDREVEQAWLAWKQRCEMPWTVDLTWLRDSGYLHA